MTYFRIKYTSCVSTIVQETDLDIQIAKNTDIFAQGDASEVRTLTRPQSSLN